MSTSCDACGAYGILLDQIQTPAIKTLYEQFVDAVNQFLEADEESDAETAGDGRTRMATLRSFWSGNRDSSLSLPRSV